MGRLIKYRFTREGEMMSKRITPQYILEIRQDRYNIENAIRKLFTECEIQSYPVNVFDIARSLNFDIIYATFTKDKIYGLMWDGYEEITVGNQKSKRCIVVNVNDSPERRAFTVAHELGHFLKHCNEQHNFFERYHGDAEQTEEEKKIEDEADFVAANILMPSWIMRKYIEIHRNLSYSKLTEKICADFLVEKEAVEKRYEELGYRF